MQTRRPLRLILLQPCLKATQSYAQFFPYLCAALLRFQIIFHCLISPGAIFPFMLMIIAPSKADSLVFPLSALEGAYHTSKPPQGCLYFVRACRYPPPKQRFLFCSGRSAEYFRMRLPTQSKHCPLHFPKRRPEPGDTADRFRALTLEVQR